MGLARTAVRSRDSAGNHLRFVEARLPRQAYPQSLVFQPRFSVSDELDAAHFHAMPASRTLGMRWALTWRHVPGSEECPSGRKAKPMLAGRGFADPGSASASAEFPTLGAPSSTHPSQRRRLTELHDLVKRRRRRSRLLGQEPQHAAFTTTSRGRKRRGCGDSV